MLDRTRVATRPPNAQDTAPLAAMLTRSFAGDALFNWWVRSEARPAALNRHFDLVLRAHLDQPGTIRVSDALDACAIWDQPASTPPRRPAIIRALRLLSLLGSDMRHYRPLRLRRLIRGLDTLRPWDRPHWYLCYLGVDPATQYNGRGSAVLRAEIAVRDRAGDATYLEVADSRTEAFYNRFGLEVLTTLQLAEGIVLRGMWRDPRP